jgi:hypothetical protein
VYSNFPVVFTFFILSFGFFLQKPYAQADAALAQNLVSERSINTAKLIFDTDFNRKFLIYLDGTTTAFGALDAGIAEHNRNTVDTIIAILNTNPEFGVDLEAFSYSVDDTQETDTTGSEKENKQNLDNANAVLRILEFYGVPAIRIKVQNTHQTEKLPILDTSINKEAVKGIVQCSFIISKRLTITEKWLSTSVNSIFSSFEFTGDGSYIAIENIALNYGNTIVYYGKYIMVTNNEILLENLGSIHVKTNAGNNVEFLLTKDEMTENYKSRKVKPVSTSNRTETLSKTWSSTKINSVDTAETPNECKLLITKMGTYLLIYPNGVLNLLSWKWKDNNEKVILYSPDQFRRWGSISISNLTSGYLKFFDFGYNLNVEGYSEGSVLYQWEFGIIP